MIRCRAFAFRTLLLLFCAVLASCNNASAPVITLSPSGTQAVDPGQSINFTATDSSMQGVNWALMSFGTLTNVTKTSVTYNAPAAVAAAEMDHLVATSIKDPKKSVTIEIDLSPLPIVTTASLLPGTVGIGYNQTLTASGGAGTLTWSISSGALPAGLTLSSAGAITGTPTGPASATPVSFTVKVTDSSNGGPMSATQALSILISNPPPPTLTMIAPASGIQGANVNVTLTGTNFVAGSTINVPAGAGISVAGITVASATSITATFTIAATATLGAQNVSVTTAGGTTGNVMFTVKPPPPTLTAIAPPIGITGTNVNVTLTGTNFVVGGSTINVPAGVGITVSGTLVTSSTTITATFAIAGTATLGAQNVSVTTAGGTTASQTFTVNPPPPTLTMISPTSGIQGANVNVTLTGTNFVVGGSTINVPAGAGITVSGSLVTSSTTITATFAIAGTATLGAQNVSVTTAGGTTANQTFTVNPPPPTLTLLNPTSGIQGTNVNVTLTGTNFVVGASTIAVTPGTGITVVGTLVTSSTTITATFQVAAGAPLGAQGVTVMTAGGTTASQSFTVAPPPTLTMINPATGNQSSNVPVTLTGTNFFSPATINFGGTGITATNVIVTSTTTITATFVIAANAPLGSQNISVTSSGVTTATVSFNVIPALPTLTTVSPNSGIQGTNVNVTLTGTNFIAGSTIAVAPGTGITVVGTTVMNATTITATFQVTAAAPLGAQSVTVMTAGGTTASRSFTVAPPPTLTMINPTSGDESSNVPVTLTGTNFFTPTTISFNGGTGITATNVMVTSTTTITATFVIAANAPLGVQNISVTTSGVTTATVAFTVDPPLPTLASLSPTQGAQGTVVSETLMGTNFIAGASTINVPAAGGISVSGTMVTSSMTITAMFTISATATLGAQNVSVTTAGGTTANQTFTVEAPPTLASINPTSGNQGANVPVTLMGTNFLSPATISFNSGTGITAGSIMVTSATTITSTFMISATAPLGAQNISVTTDGVTTSTVTFTVTVAPLMVTTTSGSLPTGTVNTPFANTFLNAVGGIQPYFWGVTGGSLPPSMGLSSSGQLMGTPTATGTFTFTVTVTDSAMPTASTTTANLSITITGGASTCPLALGGLESRLTGTYAMLFNGWNDTKGMFQAAASVTANGTGGITGGVADGNGVGQTPANNTITSGCYTIGTGGRGKMIWNFSGSGGSITFSFVMRADGKNGNLIEFDDTTGTTGGRGSGSIRLQDTTLFLASTLNGAFAFGVRGEKSDGTRVGSLGAFSLNGVNTLSGGAVDYSEPTISFTSLAATGSFTAPDATHGRGTLTITIASVPVIGNLTLHFAYYITRGGSGTIPIIYLQSTDTPDAVGHPLQNGLMAKQSGGPFSAASVTGSVIFALTGFDSSHGITNTIVGLATSAGTGTFTGFGDQEADAAPLVNVAISGTIVIGANGLGTLQITSPAVLVPTSIVMVAPNTALMLEGTQTGPGNDTQTGILQPQTGSGFNTGSLVGTFILGSDEPATTATQVEVGTVAVTSPGNITITEDNSSTGGLQPATVMTGTYTMTANGRGDVTITSGGTGTAVIWLLSTNKAVVMVRGGGDIALFNLEQ